MTNDASMFIRFLNGSTWQVLGSDRVDAAVGSSPAGIVFSESAPAVALFGLNDERRKRLAVNLRR